MWENGSSLGRNNSPWEERVKRRKVNEALPLPEKNRGRTGKRACKPVEQEENHKKVHVGHGQEPKWEIPTRVDAELQLWHDVFLTTDSMGQGDDTLWLAQHGTYPVTPKP
jgi:hypothetical protein